MCPGTVAGRFDPDQHVFRNQDYGFIEARLLQALKLIRGVNPRVRVLLTVSPVPLTATKSDAHVLVATTWSKSVLRAVAGQTAARLGFVDYFPSYEIIASTPFGGRFYEDNKRGVKRKGSITSWRPSLRTRTVAFRSLRVEGPNCRRPRPA
nr:GSCFA domain-containing protein [Roseicyclus sp.]